MRNLKRMAAFLTALILCLGLSVTASAAESDTGFSDVDAGDWYAEAAAYCRDNGLMAGTGETTFSPGTPMTRGMLVTVLYRLAGSTGPQVRPRWRMKTWAIPSLTCLGTAGTPTGSTGPG